MSTLDDAVRDAVKMGLFIRRSAHRSLRHHNILFPEHRGQETYATETFRRDMRDARRCIERAKYWKGNHESRKHSAERQDGRLVQDSDHAGIAGALR